jgi:anti-sigma B factor antagonist
MQASQASGSCASVYAERDQEAMPVELAIIEDALQRRTIVKLSGELDVASAPEVRERLLSALSPRTPSRLMLDLSKLEFIDSSGIAVLVNTERRARLVGCTVVLVAPQAPVWRVLEICGLQHHFLIAENLTALAESRPEDSLSVAASKDRCSGGESDPAAT